MRWVKAHGTLAVLLLTAAGCSHPQGTAAPAAQTVAGLTVGLRPDAPPPHVGDNTFVVTLADAAGAPVGNANITGAATALSPRLPGVTASGRAQGNGVYNLPLRLSIATRYAISLHIERPGQPPADVTFPVEAEQ